MNTTEIITTSLVVALALYLWVALSLSAVFRKAGEQSWQAWVPILNTVVVLRLGALSGWLVLLAVVPVLGTIALFVVMVIALQRINRSFGFGTGMTVLGALLFPVWASIVGWGSARWLSATPSAPPARRRVGGDAAWGPVEPAMPAPPATPAGGAPLGSVFGAHGAAGGPELPPRPAPPTIDGYPSVVPVRVGRGGAPLLPPEAAREVPPTPTFRSTMQGTPPAFAAGMGESGSARGERAFLHGTAAPSSAPDSTPSAASAAHQTRTGPNGTAPGHRLSRAAEDIDDTEGSAVQSEPPVSARASAGSWAPAPSFAARSSSFQPVLGSSELTYESSAEVSAVQGAPTSGAPRSARTSVSAQHKRPEIPGNDAVDESFDETIVAVRRRTVWTLVPALGAPIPLTAEVVIIGRRPHRHRDDGDAQLVAIPDETRTVSKTHARMELTGDGWTIMDLDSTNGVILIGEDGAEKDAAPGIAEPLTVRFLLGDAEFGLRREGE